MLRSDFVMKLMSVVLFVAIVAYLGVYIFNAANNPLKTTVAVSYVVEDSGGAEGYIIRNESVLSGAGKSVTLVAAEGEKVAKEQAVAIYYEGAQALERASEIQALQLEIREVESDILLTPAVQALNTESSILELSNAVQHQNYDELEVLATRIKALVFTNNENKPSETELATLKDRLAGLLSENSDTQTVNAPMSGIFSSVIDGYESIGPDVLEGLTPSSLQALFTPAQQNQDEYLAKVITDVAWHYAAIMDAADSYKLIGKTTARVQFTKSYMETLEMTIESISAAENGKCVVVFSARSNMADIIALRTLTAEVEFETLSGLLVPQIAVYHEDDGKAYIYLLTELQAEQVYVDILREEGDCYIVQNGTENGTVLREGSEIIIKGDDLYDKKVVA